MDKSHQAKLTMKQMIRVRVCIGDPDEERGIKIEQELNG